MAAGNVLSDSEYIGAALAVMDERLTRGGLTFYLTQDLERLPGYGPDVVAIVVGDELARVPAYFDRVRAIFKNQAVRPLLTSNVLEEPSWVNFWWFVSHLRTWGHHLPGALAYRRSKRRNLGDLIPAPVWLLPIGVLNQQELPVKPIAERRTDVFFAGSVTHRTTASGLRNLVAPKTISRRAMTTSAERLATAHPELNVQLTTTGDFDESLSRDPELYSRQLMDARIALVPRGTTADTARLWQALRYGCVVVGDTVPRHRFFYDGTPMVRLRHWRDLEHVVPALLSDRERVAELHRRSLEWWATRGAPEAVGRYMAAKLNRLSP